MASATGSESLLAARKKLQAFLRTLDTMPDAVIDEEIPKIYTEAIAQTPYRSGKLERAVYVRKSKAKERVGILAGASAKSKSGYDYAGIQHENLAFNHPIKGKARYISDPFEAGIERIKNKLRDRVDRGLK